MRGHVRGVRKRGTDLIEAERVLGGYGVGRFTSGEGSNDRRDVNARTAQARLPESHVGVHRDSREDFHGDNSNTGGDTHNWPSRPIRPNTRLGFEPA